MSQDVLDPVAEVDELAVTLARAREFARALGILDDVARRGGGDFASTVQKEAPEPGAEPISPCCVPDGGDSGKPEER
jgi:hypothetical protein